MIKYKTRTVEENIPDTIQCDVCKLIYEYNTEDYVAEIQEFVHINFVGGYTSVFGDSFSVELDICQHCFKKKLGDYARIMNDRFR